MHHESAEDGSSRKVRSGQAEQLSLMPGFKLLHVVALYDGPFLYAFAWSVSGTFSRFRFLLLMHRKRPRGRTHHPRPLPRQEPLTRDAYFTFIGLVVTLFGFAIYQLCAYWDVDRNEMECFGDLPRPSQVQSASGRNATCVSSSNPTHCIPHIIYHIIYKYIHTYMIFTYIHTHIDI